MKLCVAVFLGFSVLAAEGFLFGGSGGGSGCGCPQPSCPPPPSCGNPCAAKARAAKTASNTDPIDELELRARLAGFHLDDPEARQAASTSELAQLEKLGEDQTIPDVEAAVAAAKKSKTVRYAPQKVDTDSSVNIVRVDQSTVAPEVVSAEQTSAKDSEQKCNSEELRKIISDNITENSSESKHKVNSAAEKAFGGTIDVICSRGHFSYVYSSNLFCEAAKGEVTCIAFRQSL